MPLPREFTGVAPSGASYEEGAPQPIYPAASATQSADADRQAQQRQAQLQQQRILEALMRYQGAATYSPVLSQQQQGASSLENLAPWEQALIGKIAPQGNAAYGFDQAALKPGDRELVLRELLRRQKLEQRRRR